MCLRAYYSNATGTYSLTISDLGLDDHGDDRASATPMVAGPEAVPGKIETFGDVDCFALAAEAGHIYSFFASEGSLDLWLYFYGTDGSLLRSEDYANFAYEFGTAGTRYLCLRAYNTNATGSYTLTVTDLGLDDHADGPTGATPLGTSGVSVAGKIETAGDEDWFAVSVVNGLVYQVSVTGIGRTTTVLGANGSSVITSSSASTFTFTVGSSGGYYLRVTSSGTGSYTVAVQE